MKRKNRILLKDAMILTLDEQDRLLDKASILIEGDEIIQIDEMIEPLPGDQVIDCTGKLAVPGFVNSHLHSDEHMHKGMYDNMPLQLWMLYAYAPIGFSPLSERFIYLRTMIGAIENIRSGVTCMQDDVSELPHPTMEGHGAMIRAYNEIGVRLNLSTQEIEKSILDNIPYMKQVLPCELQELFGTPRSSETIVKQAEEMIQEWDRKDDVRIVCSISAPERASAEHARAMYQVAEKYDTPFHIHVNESRIQQITGREYYGTSIPDYSRRIGILSPRTTIAHSIWVTDQDIQIYADCEVNIAHNLLSNLKLGSGLMPLIKMREAGVSVCLGCDGTCSNDSQNLLEVMKTAALLHKITTPDYHKWPDAGEILYMATKNGARSTMRGKEIGSIETGKKADIVIYDLGTVNFTPLTNVRNQLVYSENGRSVEKVIIKGKLVMDHHEILTVDEKAICNEAKEMFSELLEKQNAVNPISDKLYPYLEQIYWRCIDDPEEKTWRYTATREEYR